MTRAKSDRVFFVKHGFYAMTKDKRRVYFTRANQHEIGELLTNEQIETFKGSGSIIEDGEQTPEDRIVDTLTEE